MLLECFVYTNGRSTYNSCISYLQVALKNVSLQEEAPKKIQIFQDKKLVDAMNRTLDICQGTHFIKVDDDFILHPAAVYHMLRYLRDVPNPNIAVYDWHLWEVWTSRIISGIKIYSVEALKSIGGLTVDRYAKFDKVTNARLKNSGFSIRKDASILGLHSCGTWEEQKHYEKLWSASAQFPYEKSTHEEQKQYNVPIEEQVKFIDTGFLEQLNQKYHTNFFDWAGRKNDPRSKRIKNKARIKKKLATKNSKVSKKVQEENDRRLAEVRKWKNTRTAKDSGNIKTFNGRKES